MRDRGGIVELLVSIGGDGEASEGTYARARTAVRSCIANGATAIAVSFLWAFRNPAHERRMRERDAETERSW